MTRTLGAAGLALVLVLAGMAPAFAAEHPPDQQQVVLVLVEGATPDELLSVPQVKAIASAGGDGFFVPSGPEDDDAALRRALESNGLRVGYVLGDFTDVPSPHLDISFASLAGVPDASAGADRDVVLYLGNPVPLSKALGVPRSEALGIIGNDIETTLRAMPSDHALVIVAGVPAEGGDVRPAVLARGDPAALLRGGGIGEHTIYSDTTRRDGVVSSIDFAPTILDFFEIPIPAEMNGSPIRVVDESPPFELHERHLAQRRMYVPVGIGAGIAVTVFALLAILCLALRSRWPRFALDVGTWCCLATPVLAAGMFRAGQFPTLSYANVVPFLVILTLVLTAVFLWFRRFSVLGPPVALGVFMLAGLLLQALQGWPAAVATLIGGTALDGVRFYGMPNVIIGLLLGGVMYIAAAVRPYTGFVLLVAAGLFAGLPSLGANIGGAITLFAAAGVWLAVGEGRRFGWRGLGVTALTTVAGTAVVLAAHRFLAPVPTHATTFVESTSLAGAWSTYIDRLGVGWQLLLRNPFGFIPMIGLLVTLVIVLKPPRVIAEGFDMRPQWARAIRVIAVAGVVAYLANDTGVAASGFAFAMALGGALYVPLAAVREKMVG